MSLLSEISLQLQRGKLNAVEELVNQAIDEKIPVRNILEDGLLAGMDIIGEKFKSGDIFIPEVLIAARALNAGTEILKPLIAQSGIKAGGKVCLGTVKGDLHDIGKNLVKMMMEGKGLEVIDLGTDVSPETFIQTAAEQDCGIIACSALLTTTMGVMKDVVEAVKNSEISGKVKIMVGGAPVTQSFCDRIGADCYTPDAASAAQEAVKLMHNAQCTMHN